MGNARVLLFASVIVSGLLQIEGALTERFSVTSKHSTEGECSYTVYVKGKGVDDHFDLPCDSKEESLSLGDESYALYESPNHPLSFYTEKANSLVVFTGDGQKCKERKYSMKRGKIGYKESKMSARQCEDVKLTMGERKKARNAASKSWGLLASAVQNGVLNKLIQ